MTSSERPRSGGARTLLGIALVAAALVAVAAAPVAAGAAGPANASSARRHRRRQWHAPNAAKLVGAVVHARTAAKRHEAIEAVMKGLGIGVYTPAGKRVVGGFERNANGLYLYTWEIDYLADQLGRGQRSSLEQAATQLAYAGLTLHGKPVTGASLGKAIRKGIKRLAKPRQRRTPAGALAAVVKALGQAHHVNLTKKLPATKPVLDPLQSVLLAVDGLRSATGHATRGQPARPAKTGAASATASGAHCSGSFSGGLGYARGIRSMIGSGGKSGGAGIIKQEIKDGLDGSVMAYSVAIVPLGSKLKGAFGANGPGSAAPMRFQVKVVMRDEFGHPGGNCGRAAGYKLPRKGGIPGVPVVWTRDAAGNLTYLGQTPSCSTLCTSTTDGDGIATLTFQPDDEYLPGAGPTITEAGAVSATEFSDAAQGNLLGTIAEAIGFSKEAQVPWEISYHNPGGYRVEVPSFSETWIIDEGEEGEDPLTATYSFENEEVCTRGRGAEHPLQPREPELGSSGSTAKVISSDSAGTFTASGGPAPIPIDFQPVAPRDYRNGQEDGAPQIDGLWVFDSPTLAALITATPTPFVIAGPPSPPSQGFEIPVTQAKNCGNGFG